MMLMQFYLGGAALSRRVMPVAIIVPKLHGCAQKLRLEAYCGSPSATRHATHLADSDSPHDSIRTFRLRRRCLGP